jgi:hypothetical protein
VSVRDSKKRDGEIVRILQDHILHGGHSLHEIPETLTLIINKGLWRERVVLATGEVKTYESFEEFVTDSLPDGLGTDVRTLKNLCGDDTEALDALDRATTGKHGGDHTSKESKSNNVKLAKAPEGTSNTYALRKLRKDRPDLHQQILDGEKSAHAAMIEAGFRKKSISVNLYDASSAARTLKAAGSSEYIDALARELVSDK